MEIDLSSARNPRLVTADALMQVFARPVQTPVEVLQLTIVGFTLLVSQSTTPAAILSERDYPWHPRSAARLVV